MQNQDYHTEITVNASPENVMEKIFRINEWWIKNYTDKAEKVNDQFHVPMGKTYVDFQITEFVPGKKLVWKVTNSHIPGLRNISEWNGAEVIFELWAKGNQTQINFTHKGLTPDVECFEMCNEGWNKYINSSLLKLINEGTGLPN